MDLLEKLNLLKTAHAHCDVPCGVYETDSAKWAAETCMKMVDKIQGLQQPSANDKQATIDYLNTVARSISVKEEFAKICKDQLLILWTDHFKPEHLQKWPDLHDKIWKACKQCSTVKRTVKMEEAKKLQDMVKEIAEIFAESKKMVMR